MRWNEPGLELEGPGRILGSPSISCRQQASKKKLEAGSRPWNQDYVRIKLKVEFGLRTIFTGLVLSGLNSYRLKPDLGSKL